MKLSEEIDLERGNWDWPGQVETSLEQWAEQARALEAELDAAVATLQRERDAHNAEKRRLESRILELEEYQTAPYFR